MGLFSFYTADTNRVIKVSGRGNSFPVALLVPEEFGGGKIIESSYDGYGHFGEKEVFELLAEWNLEHLCIEMLEEPIKENYSREWFYRAAIERREKLRTCLQDYKTESSTVMAKKYGREWKRNLMILFFCELSEDNKERLKYPLKIVENTSLSYEDVKGESRECDNCLL